MRLDQFLAHYALFSRKEAGKIIRSGQVSVNAEICKNAGKNVCAEKDSILFRGEQIRSLPANLTAIFYKTPGYLTAARDQKQPTVMDFVPKSWQRLGIRPVGRLDKDTSGALLFTTEGQLAHRLLSPKSHCRKRYIFTYLGEELGTEESERIAAGSLLLEDGPCMPGRLFPNLKSLKTDLQLQEKQISAIFNVFVRKHELKKSAATTIESPYHFAGLELHEGRFHQVKRMLHALGREVVHLHRLDFAGVHVHHLTPGEIRLLNENEVQRLKELVNLAD